MLVKGGGGGFRGGDGIRMVQFVSTVAGCLRWGLWEEYGQPVCIVEEKGVMVLGPPCSM